MASSGRGDDYTDFLDFLKRNPGVRRMLFTDLDACIDRYNGHADDSGRLVPKFHLHHEEIRRLVRAWEREFESDRDELDHNETGDNLARGWNM